MYVLSPKMAKIGKMAKTSKIFSDFTQQIAFGKPKV
jgi:hypothetical protein